MIICCDIDGCLADFNSSYIALIKEVAGVDLFPSGVPSGYVPQCWNFPEALGYSEEVLGEVWGRIRASRTFWESLLPLPEVWDIATTGLTSRKHDIYFLTDRSGIRAKWQTERWLSRYVTEFPTALLVKDKAPVVRALHADVIIDDKFETIKNVEYESPMTRAFLINRPYNQVTRFPGEDDVIRRADSVKEVLDELGA